MKTCKQRLVCFIGSTVPEEDEFMQLGLSRAGNLAQNGIVESLAFSGLNLDCVLTLQPIAYYPRVKVLFRKTRVVRLNQMVTTTITPLINLPVLRDIVRAIYVYTRVLCWSVRNARHDRVVVMYNMTNPPALPLFAISRVTGAKFVSVLYDVDTEVCQYSKRSVLQWFIYWFLGMTGNWCIPHIDGRIVITTAIAEYFAPGKHSLLLDGGFSESSKNLLFPLKEKKSSDDLIVFYAGGLREWDYVHTVLDMMSQNPDLNIKLWLAGHGELEDRIKEIAEIDHRISFFGELSHSEVFEKYKEADVLLAMRNESAPDMKLHFPSKLIEVLTVGKIVVANNFAHVKKEYGSYCYVLDDVTVSSLLVAVSEILELSSHARKEFGCHTREFMLKSHTWKVQGKRIYSYIDEQVFG